VPRGSDFVVVVAGSKFGVVKDLQDDSFSQEMVSIKAIISLLERVEFEGAEKFGAPIKIVDVISWNSKDPFRDFEQEMALDCY
jgi:hypothetical protein